MFNSPEDVRDCLSIDKHDLDGEFIRFPQMLGEVGAQVAEQNAEKEWLRVLLERKRSSVYSDTKTDLDAYGEKNKYTEKFLEHKVTLHSEVLDAHDVYMDQKSYAERWERALAALVVKGQMLKQLAGLYATEYFTSNSAQAVTSTKQYQEASNKNNRQRLTQDRKRRRERLD